MLVGDDSELSDPEYYQEAEISALRNRRRVSFRGLNKGPRSQPRQYNRRFVSQMSPDESGEEDDQFEDCETSPEQERQRGNDRPRDQSRANGDGSGGKPQTPPTARTGIQSIRGTTDSTGAEPIHPSVSVADHIQALEDEGILDLLTDQNCFSDL